MHSDGVRGGWGEYFSLNGSLNQHYYNHRNQIINTLEPGTPHHDCPLSLFLTHTHSCALHTPFCKLAHYLDLLIPSIFVEVVTMINKQTHTVIKANINVFGRVCVCLSRFGFVSTKSSTFWKAFYSKLHKQNLEVVWSECRNSCQNKQNRHSKESNATAEDSSGIFTSAVEMFS